MGIGGFMSKLAPAKSGAAESREQIVMNATSAGNAGQSNNRPQFAAHNTNAVTPLVDDELSAKLFSSVVAIVEDRRQLALSLDEYKRYLRDAEMSIEELKREKKAAQLLVERKEEEIEAVRRQVAEKQLKYDQLMEDYKQLRANHAKEYERLQEQIREMRLNYENLNSDYARFRAESAKEVERLEAAVRANLVKYHQLVEKYNKVKEENSRLTAHIVNFTQQMSALRLPEQQSDADEQVVPIHPVVNGDPNGPTTL